MAQLQNIPSRKKPEKYDPRVQNLGPKIRSMFVESPPDEIAPEGYSLIDSDLSQLEIRLGAHFTQDYTLLKVYRDVRNLDEFTFYVGDIHAETSVKMKVPRKLAKNLNFGLFYGMGADRFAVYADLFIPGTLEYDLTASAKYVSDFQGVYHGVFSYHHKLRDRWREGQRAFVLLDGSYRHFPKYPNISGGTIYNSKIQGSAARVMNAHIWALGKYVLPNPEFRGLRLLMQVHDEVMAEAPKSIAQKCAVMIKYIQEYPWYATDVPLLASTKIVRTWDQKDDDDIPEVGTFYAEIEGVPTLFKPRQWADYRALEKQKKVGTKGCVAMLTEEQKAWARSMLPEHLPTFSREEGGVRIMSLEAYKALKAQRKKEEDGGSDD